MTESHHPPALRVMLTTHGPGRNPFIPQLVRALEENGVEARYFSWKDAVLGRYDVLHLQWVEALYIFDPPLRRSLKRALLRWTLFLARRTRKPLVQTLHNLHRHDTLPSADQKLFDEIMKQVTLDIFMNAPAGDGAHIPHGHYRDWHQIAPTRPPAGPKPVVSTVGQVRRYKNFEELVDAFADERVANVDLVIAGAARPKDYAVDLQRRASGSENVTVRDEFLTEDEMISLIQRSHLVVLPYPEIYNSGVLFLALSVGRPVLVRRGPITVALQTEFGNEWVLLFDGILSWKDIDEAVQSARVTLDLPTWPAMDSRGWDVIGRQHVQAYERALSRIRT